jgi:hypothetical protein
VKKGVKKIIGGGLLFIFAMLLPFACVIPFFVLEGKDRIFRAPGSIEVSVEKPGRYYLWDNYSTVFEGRSYSFEKELPNGLVFSLIEKESGSVIPLNADSSVSSDSGNQKKVTVGYFELTRPGTYLLSITGNTETRIFSFGRSLFGHIILIIFGVLFAVTISFAVAIGSFVFIVLGIIELVRESKPAPQECSAGKEDKSS